MKTLYFAVNGAQRARAFISIKDALAYIKRGEVTSIPVSAEVANEGAVNGTEVLRVGAYVIKRHRMKVATCGDCPKLCFGTRHCKTNRVLCGDCAALHYGSIDTCAFCGRWTCPNTGRVIDEPDTGVRLAICKECWPKHMGG